MPGSWPARTACTARPLGARRRAHTRYSFVLGVVAQSVEHRTFNPLVLGSIPSHPTISLI